MVGIIRGMSGNFVIIAQPDWNLRNVLRQHLDDRGFHTLVTPMPAEAEDIARQIRACLVILDIELPGITGYEACVRIRRIDGYNQVPIVLLTGQDLPRRREAARQAGADALLVKPFSMNDLMRRIAPLLRDGPLGGPCAADPPDGTEAYGPAPVQVWRAPPVPERRTDDNTSVARAARLLELIRTSPRR